MASSGGMPHMMELQARKPLLQMTADELIQAYVRPSLAARLKRLS
jgi:hypothetical protein